MATQLETVMLKGRFRNQEATAYFVRKVGGPGWRMTITVAGTSWKQKLSGRGWKPCWTVAVTEMESRYPAKDRQPKSKEPDDDGMILKIR